MFMTTTEMQAFATDKGLYDQMKWSRSVSILRADLANLLHRLDCGDDGDDFVEVEAGENGYLAEFLRSAFMQPAKKGREEGQTQYMAEGHRAEKPFLKEFFEITQQYETAHVVEAVYSPGAVMTKSRMFNRDSSDGVVIYSRDPDDDDVLNRRNYGAKPAEVKARVSPRTYQKERNNITRVKQMLIDDESDSTWFYSRGAADGPIYAHIDAFYAVNSEDDSDDSDDKQDWRLNPILQAAIPGK